MTIQDNNEHYVYLYLRKSDRTPYYVGKGKGSRYKKEHNVTVPSNEENIVFVRKSISNEEACELEKELIALYGRKDLGEGILHNRTNGGDGGDTSDSPAYKEWLETVARNPESKYIKGIRHRMRTNNPMHNPETVKKNHSPEARKKRGESLRGRKLSEEQKEKIRKTVLSLHKENSERTKDFWKNEGYRYRATQGMKGAVSKRKSMTEEEFYDWIKDKKLFTSKNTINAVVKSVVDHFGKTEEFYGDYIREKEQEKERKKSWDYYKTSSEEEFYDWIKKQNVFRVDGNLNPRIWSVITYRNLQDHFL